MTNPDKYYQYDFEEVMFRIEGQSGLIYRKFYHEPEEAEPIPHYTRIFADTLLFGKEITKDEYEQK